VSSSPKTVTPGMRFASARTTAGTATVGAWEVVELFNGSDDIAYARLANVTDPSKVKSVACDALMNTRLYRPIG
jgi:hypothetical protein